MKKKRHHKKFWKKSRLIINKNSQKINQKLNKIKKNKKNNTQTKMKNKLSKFSKFDFIITLKINY